MAGRRGREVAGPFEVFTERTDADDGSTGLSRDNRAESCGRPGQLVAHSRSWAGRSIAVSQYPTSPAVRDSRVACRGRD